eukprot:365249-Chlamydomonas_euryale.AAC.12
MLAKLLGGALHGQHVEQLDISVHEVGRVDSGQAGGNLRERLDRGSQFDLFFSATGTVQA